MSDTFAAEVLKLLLQMAFSDDELAPEEAEILKHHALVHGFDADELDAAMSGRVPLPAPNLGLLKGRAEEALTAARDILVSDGLLAQDEIRTLRALAELLRG